MVLQNITTDNESKQPIDARKLYNALGYANGQFSRWSKKNIEDNHYFFENTDWCKVETIIFNSDGDLEQENDKNLDTDVEQNLKTLDINGEQIPNRIKKDYALTFDMAYHLTLQSSTQIAHEVRQALINHKKATELKEKQISLLTQEDLTETERYEAVKIINRESAKEMRFLEIKAKKRKEKLNCLILGKTDITTVQKLQNQYEQLNLFDNNTKRLE
ncbi:antA/AntB antirepressor family protein [Flavobacterium davisii]|uniref:antA/AntB antirepressor family protein n=1 Tax=Flavobacterium davisii TaxID=2906077 RepID=UPI0035D08C8A